MQFDESSGLVTISQYEYVRLLINASVTEAKRWPKALRKGARLLSKIRRIEADCIKRCGEFDWEQLDRDTQDLYDGTCADLTLLVDKRPATSWEEVRRKRSE